MSCLERVVCLNPERSARYLAIPNVIGSYLYRYTRPPSSFSSTLENVRLRNAENKSSVLFLFVCLFSASLFLCQFHFTHDLYSSFFISSTFLFWQTPIIPSHFISSLPILLSFYTVPPSPFLTSIFKLRLTSLTPPLSSLLL